jgi:hypothetical protein
VISIGDDRNYAEEAVFTDGLFKKTTDFGATTFR